MPPHILIALPAPLLPMFNKVCFLCIHCRIPSYAVCKVLKEVTSKILKELQVYFFSTPCISSPEPRKGNASNLSLSPSGPGAVVPRSNRDVPLPESGSRGKRDCMA